MQLVYGPPVDQGFYYDMSFPDGVAISSDDFERIEQEMTRIVKEDRPFTRYELPLAEGLVSFAFIRARRSKLKSLNCRLSIDSIQFFKAL